MPDTRPEPSERPSTLQQGVLAPLGTAGPDQHVGLPSWVLQDCTRLRCKIRSIVLLTFTLTSLAAGMIHYRMSSRDESRIISDRLYRMPAMAERAVRNSAIGIKFGHGDSQRENTGLHSLSADLSEIEHSDRAGMLAHDMDTSCQQMLAIAREHLDGLIAATTTAPALITGATTVSKESLARDLDLFEEAVTGIAERLSSASSRNATSHNAELIAIIVMFAAIFIAKWKLILAPALTLLERRTKESAEHLRWAERLSQVARRTSNAVIVTDRQGRIEWVNEGFTRITGYTHAEVIGKEPGSLLQGPPSDKEQRAKMGKAVEAGESITTEIVNYGKSGLEYIVRIELEPLRETGGEVTGFMAIETDVTAARKNDRVLKAQNGRLELALEGGNLGTWDWDVQTDTVQVDDRWLKIYGARSLEGEWRESEIAAAATSGTHWLYLTTSGSHAGRPGMLERCRMAGTSTFQFENYVQRPDGRWRWVLTRARVVAWRDAEGRPDEPARIAGTCEDITDRKEAEERYLTLVNNIPGVVYRVACDEHWTNLFVSDGIEAITGYPPSDFIGNAVRDCSSITHPEDRGLVDAEITAALEQRRAYSMDYRILHKNGEERWVRERGRGVYEGEKAIYIDGVQFDITEQHRAEVELVRMRDAAEAGSRAKSEFLANMSHEIRTPLTAILGYSDLLIEEGTFVPDETPASGGEGAGPSDAQRKDTRQMVWTIRRAACHLLNLINSILDLSKIEAGRMTVDLTPTPLGNVLAEVESFSRPRATEKHVGLHFRIDTPVPERIITEPVHLRQIVMNLVANAVKFTDAGSVTVRTSVADTPSGQRLWIDVEDTGPGLTEKQVAILFSPFTQGDSTTARRHGGTGLGLAISRRLARLLDGDVTITRTAVGQGTVFRVDLPLNAVPGARMMTDIDRGNRDEAIAGLGTMPEVVRLWGGGTHTVPGIPAAEHPPMACRILFAEDGPDNQRLVSHYLRKAGAEVDIAENGMVALEMFERAVRQSKHYALIITDMQMPVMDGYGLASAIRKMGATVPIIALTAHAMAEDRHRCLKAGCDDYASKPINKQDLLRICRRWTARPGVPQTKVA